MNSAQFFTNRPQPAAHIMAAKDAAAAAAASAKAQQPFVIPLGVDSLVAANSAGELACRRFMSAVDEPYLKQRGLPLTLLKGCQSGELPAVNEVTQSLRDHATASLTPTIVRQGFLLAHLFNMRYCKVVEALHQNPQQSLTNPTINSSSSSKAALEESCHGHAQQETCGGSSCWLEDLQLCVELSKGKREEVGSKREEAQQNDDADKLDRKATPQAASSPPSSLSIDKNAASTVGGQTPAPSSEVLAQYVRFGSASWMRILPAALNLAAKINHVMIRRHVMRYCILDNCQRVSGTNITVPAPCAWISQLQSYEIAMLEVLSSHRLADRRIPEGHLRLLLWSLQAAVGNEWFRQNQINEDQIDESDRNNINTKDSDSNSGRIVFPAEGFFASPMPQSSPSPHGLNAVTSSSAAATANPPKLAQSFREAVQMGAMALLTFCYRSTELLLYGSICTVKKQMKGGDVREDNGTCPQSEDNATTTTTAAKEADSSSPTPQEEKWSSATEVGSFRSGLLAHYSGESASFDAAVMCFVAAFSHTLEITLGATRKDVMAIRKVFFKELVDNVLSERAEEYAIARGWIKPPIISYEQPSSPLPALSASSLNHRPTSPLANAPPQLPPAGMKPYAYVAPPQPSQLAPLSSSLSPLNNSSSANYYSVPPATATAVAPPPPNAALLPSTTAFLPTQKAPFSSSSSVARGSADPPPSPDALETYFVDFIGLFNMCARDEVVKRDSPSPAMLDYFARVAKLVA